MSKRTFFICTFCGECTYGSTFGRENVEIESKCKCKDSRPQEVCSFCFTVRYLLNFKCYKLCIDTLPVVPLGEYLKKIDGDPFFFYLSQRTGLIEISLDNPKATTRK